MRALPLAVSGRRTVQMLFRGLIFAGIAAALSACNTTVARDTTGSIPRDYRERHPIAIKEGKKTLLVMVGAGRGGLSPMQRAEVLAFAQNWKRDATGGITVERPVGAGNDRAANDTLKEALSILVQAGVPQRGIGVRPYDAVPGPKTSALRFNYPLMVADAGPCGLWPSDLGPSNDPKHFQNGQYYNFGCANQRALAAMVENPADLVQPRAEGPAYTAKRSVAIDKWRKGENPSTVYPDPNKGSVSEIGK